MPSTECRNTSLSIIQHWFSPMFPWQGLIIVILPIQCYHGKNSSCLYFKSRVIMAGTPHANIFSQALPWQKLITLISSVQCYHGKNSSCMLLSRLYLHCLSVLIYGGLWYVLWWCIALEGISTIIDSSNCNGGWGYCGCTGVMATNVVSLDFKSQGTLIWLWLQIFCMVLDIEVLWYFVIFYNTSSVILDNVIWSTNRIKKQ